MVVEARIGGLTSDGDASVVRSLSIVQLMNYCFIDQWQRDDFIVYKLLTGFGGEDMTIASIKNDVHI